MALRNAPAWLALVALATPAAAQFGGLIPRDAQNVLNDAQATDACGNKKKSSAGSRVLGGVLAYVFFAIGTRHFGADEFAGVGRNEACPCGSGKKYKRCHGDPRLRN